MVLQSVGAIEGVDSRDNTPKHVASVEEGVTYQCMNDRRRIGQSCRLDDDAIESRNITPRALAMQIQQGLPDVTSNRATEAT